MKNFIVLHQSFTENKVLVNPEYISALCESDLGTKVYSVGDGNQCFTVKESMEEITNMLGWVQ